MILLVGNCHIESIKECLDVMTNIEIQCHRIKLEFLDQNMEHDSVDELNAKAEEADSIFVMSRFKDTVMSSCGHLEERMKFIPYIRTTAFHPDAVPCYTTDRQRIRTLMGNSNSALILYGYLNELSVDDTMLLFCEEVYDYLEYFDAKKKFERIIKLEEEITGWPVQELYRKLYNGGCFVHTTNHPLLHVFAELSHLLLKEQNIVIDYNDSELKIADRGAQSPIWPVYPEIAERLGIEGSYEFKLSENQHNLQRAKQKKIGSDSILISLREFVEDSFEKYATIGKENIDDWRYNRLPFSTLKGSQAFNIAMNRNKNRHSNPYKNLPDYRFWRRSVTKLNMEDVDPVLKSKFKIFMMDKVATAGSCFAQQIARTLKRADFNFFVTETAPKDISKQEAKERNYNVYSARYGNIYTTRQLVQMLDRIDGIFTPVDEAWVREDGQYVDPFRPLIEPNGFNTVEELKRSRDEHLDCVKKMFEELDIFLFTLGLTEAWRSKIDGAVIPLAPGIAGGVMDEEKYEFVNFSSEMVIKDMQRFSKRMFEINPNAKIIFTVSPVPMIATYEDQHIITSSTYSKSVLRVAAEEVSRDNPNIAYFPSYEVITSNFNRGKYYSDDLRSVTEEGIDHVMRLLVQHYLSGFDDSEFLKEMDEDDIICDDEVLDP